MSLSTHSKFFFGYEVTTANNKLDFDEGGPEITATLDGGSYTVTEYLAEVARAMNAVGGQTYTVSLNRTTRIVTVSAVGTFALLTTSGTNSGSSTYTLLGYSGADKTGASSYVAGSETGSEYTTQFILQGHVPSAHWSEAAFAVVNESTSGQVEVVKFGNRRFLNFEFKWLTNQTMSAGVPIRNRATGVQDFLTFADFLITRAPFEFMEDEDTPATFQKLILESTPASGNGTGFRLQELTGQGLPGYYKSGTYKFRVVT